MRWQELGWLKPPAPGMFRAASPAQVLAGMGRVFCRDSSGTGDAYDFTKIVDQVDVFISHSWSAGRWGKTLAVCFHLNGSFAVKSALVAAAAGPMCLAASGDVNNLVSSPYLFLLAVDLPLLVFFLSFFFAHVCRCGCTSPTMWIDSLCIPQTSEALKQEAISMLPAFVKCSSEMLILWDNTYCDRLWCCMEMSLFLKKGDLRKLHIVPVWLAPWLLCTMFLDWFCARLTLPLVFFFWSGGQEGNEAPVSRWGILAEYTVLWGIILVAYLPALLPALVSFVAKIQQHQAMLKQLQAFDIRSAKCSIEEDRTLLEAIVARVYDGIDDAPISVVFSADEFSTSLIGPDAALLLPAEAEVLRDEAVRNITSYPDFAECLEIFNEQVRGPLLRELRRDLGEVTHIPINMCMLAMLPTFLFSIATAFLACDGLPCDLAPKAQGFQSLMQMWTYDGLGLSLITWPGFQSLFPLLLRVLGAVLTAETETGFHPLKAGSCVMVWLCGLGLYIYLFLLMGLANALLLISLTKPPSLPWLAGFGAIVLLLLFQNARIRAYNLETGYITAKVGSVPGYSGDGGDPTQARLNGPTGVACDSLRGYWIADTGNSAIRGVLVVPGQSDVISTVIGGLGTGLAPAGTWTTWGAPRSLAFVEAGNAIARFVPLGTRVMEGAVQSVIGTGTSGFRQNPSKTNIAMDDPEGIAVHHSTVFVSDTVNHRIIMVPILEYETLGCFEEVTTGTEGTLIQSLEGDVEGGLVPARECSGTILDEPDAVARCATATVRKDLWLIDTWLVSTVTGVSSHRILPTWLKRRCSASDDRMNAAWPRLLTLLAALGAAQEPKPLVANYLGCYDTRDRENYGFRKKHWASSLDDVMFKCSMFRYVVLECPSEARAVFWCTNQLFPETMKLEHGNCYGDPGSAKKLNGGSNGLCSGPYWWPLLEGSVALGGWQRGAVYSVVRDLGLLAEAPGKDVATQEVGFNVSETSEDGSYFFVEKRDWQVHFGPLENEDGVAQVVEQRRDGELVWAGSVKITLPGAAVPSPSSTTPTLTTTKAPAKARRTKAPFECSVTFSVPKIAQTLPGRRKCHTMVLASAGSEVNVSALRKVGQLGKFISGKVPGWRAYRKNLFDYRVIGKPGTKRQCKDADEDISEEVSFDFFPPGRYELRLYNGRAREERNVTFLGVVQLMSDCSIKDGCGTKGLAHDAKGPGRACVFPFRYDGVQYTECTMVKASAKWCATETDANGHYISGKWGHCNDACFEEESKAAAEDEVAQVTYSKVGAGVSCGEEAYRSADSPEQCQEWCTQNEDCKAFVTFEDSPCDSCLAFTDNDCSMEYQKASNCTGQISAYKKILPPEKKKGMRKEECTATFTYKNCKDGQDDRDITVGFSAAFEGYPLTYTIEYGAEGGDNSLGCHGSFRDADLKFMDANGDNKVVTLVDNELAAAEVTNVRFSNNCPMKKAAVKESCSVTFFYRDCGSSANNEDRTVSFSAYFMEEMLGYSLEYSNGGGTNTDGCGGTFRDASLNFIDANDQSQSLVLVDNNGPAAEVSNFRFSKNCPMKQVTLPTVANVKPDWSKPLVSVMTALSSPMHSEGPI
eukprot:s2487_g2.t1